MKAMKVSCSVSQAWDRGNCYTDVDSLVHLLSHFFNVVFCGPLETPDWCLEAAPLSCELKDINRLGILNAASESSSCCRTCETATGVQLVLQHL